MKQINNKDALNKLLQAGPEFLIEADDLNYMIKSEKSVTCYEDSDCIVYIGNMGQENDTDFVNVVPFNESFDIPIFMQLISENCSNPSLMINVQKLSDVFIDKLDSLLNENFEYQKI